MKGRFGAAVEFGASGSSHPDLTRDEQRWESAFRVQLTLSVRARMSHIVWTGY